MQVVALHSSLSSSSFDKTIKSDRGKTSNLIYISNFLSRPGDYHYNMHPSMTRHSESNSGGGIIIRGLLAC